MWFVTAVAAGVSADDILVLYIQPTRLFDKTAATSLLETAVCVFANNRFKLQ